MARKPDRYDDDDDDDEIESPRRRKRRPEKSNSTVWIIGGLVLGFVMLMGVCVIAGVGLIRSKGPPAPPELEGTWKMTSLEMNGQRRTGNQLPYDRVVISGNTFTTYNYDGSRDNARIRVDATRNPKEIDVVDKGLYTYPAIYKIEGDTLTICIGDLGASRPRDFSTRGLTGTGGLATYKRVSP